MVTVHIKDEDINIHPVCRLQMDKFNRNIMIGEMNEKEIEIAKNNISYNDVI